MNDYRLITVFGKETISLTPEHTTLIHLKMVKMIEECQKDKIIVLGHHLPSYDCVHKQFEGSPLNCGFASNLDYLFSKVKFWIHGHTHSSVDFEKNGCRVLCNPKGYRKENLYGFDPTKSFTT